MAQKNRYLRHARVSEVKLREVLKYFCADLTASQAGELAGLECKTALRLFTLFRERMAALAANECPFEGAVEIDESYFGANRVRGRRGRGAGRKIPVFGILERGGRVHTQIVRNCSKTTLQAIILGKIDPAASVHSDGWRAYDGLVEAGFAKHHRIRHQEDSFAAKGVHINGIESFWSFAKRRLAKFNGVPPASFPLFLKETEFRFNHRHRDLYRIMIASIREVPLGS
jgi:transposase-like protein